MKTQKDLLNDLIDALDDDNQENESTENLDDNQAISEDGEVITLDY